MTRTGRRRSCAASRRRVRRRTSRTWGSGFEFQDVEADVEADFQRHRLFAIDLAESSRRPSATPVTHGNTVKDFYVDDFADSYGSPQRVAGHGEAGNLGDIVGIPVPDQRRPGEDCRHARVSAGVGA